MAELSLEEYAKYLRDNLVDIGTRSIKLTRFTVSEQRKDLSEPPNCQGLGRLRHFNRTADLSQQGKYWPPNPLPIDPARCALGLEPSDSLVAQVFQSSGCNWNCWYCYVPVEDRTSTGGDLISVTTMVDLFLNEPNRPLMIDLTGGQPDLTPEWTVWFMEELVNRHIDDVFLWSDDNLSTDFFWKYLDSSQIALLSSYPLYGRACCLKGFDPDSFSFNTSAPSALFDNQYEVLKRLYRHTEIDIYLYVTLTCQNTDNVENKLSRFMDRLQTISETLPLRTVPLRIQKFTPTQLGPEREKAIDNQFVVVGAWQDELLKRFTPEQLSIPIPDIPR